ncbi:hypothetical protein [uncultured Stenotrophomonas sp.]|uniref:hypothetical protein n=1 Tax=uncultured Stenotrophomonas sp. TaxID=165438 RepID=UPI0026000B2D|nr:hypothetical protein [uncultured Stenotrophomonas sp.]
MTQNAVAFNPTVHPRVVSSTALEGTLTSMKLRNVQNAQKQAQKQDGDAVSEDGAASTPEAKKFEEPLAPCNLGRVNGRYECMVYSDAVSTAARVLIDAAKAAPSTAEAGLLEDAVAHLVGGDVPPFGIVVNHQLTVLGAIHASLTEALANDPNNEDLLVQRGFIAAEIIEIGQKAARIGKGGREGDKSVSGCTTSGGAKENDLRRAIAHSDKVLRTCRRVVGDEVLFRGLGDLMSRSMNAAVAERRPGDVALLKDATGADLMKMLYSPMVSQIDDKINLCIASGGAADFRAAVMLLLTMPEYVLPADGKKVAEAPADEAAEPPIQAGPGGIGGIGNQVVGNNGNQKLVGGNITGGNVTVNNNHNLGDFGRQLERAFNLGERSGRQIRGLQAENARLRAQLERARQGRARSNRAQVQRDLRQRVETIKAELAKPRGAGAATTMAAPTPAKALMPTSLMTTVMVRLAETMPAMAQKPAAAPSPLALPAPPPPRAMDEVLAQLRVALDGWWAREGAPVEPQQGVTGTPSVAPSQLGSTAPSSARHWQSPDSPAEAVVAELKHSFAQLPVGELPTPGQMLALHGRVARLVGPGAPHATLESAIEELRQGVAAPAAVTAAERSEAWNRQSPRMGVPLPMRRVVTTGDVIPTQQGSNPDRRELRRSDSLSSIDLLPGQALRQSTEAQRRQREAALHPAPDATLASALKQSFSSLPAGEFPSPSQVRGAPVDDSRIRTLGPRMPTLTEQFVAELAASPLVARHAAGATVVSDSSEDESSLSDSVSGSDTGSLFSGSDDDEASQLRAGGGLGDGSAAPRNAPAHDSGSRASHSDDDDSQEQLLHEAMSLGRERFQKLAGPRYGLSAAQRDAVIAQLWPAEAEDAVQEELQAFLARIEEENARPRVLTLPEGADVEALVRQRAAASALPPSPDGNREAQIGRLANTVRGAAQRHAQELDDYANLLLYPQEKRWLYEWGLAAQPAAPAATFQFSAREELGHARHTRRGSERSQRLSLGADADARAEQKKQLAREGSLRSQGSGVSVQS